ncbi:MAG: hypothetical protein SWO11_04785 [Thermodesulfobacteriota bacterium]|nr:hypothetical protein [Thermodesulfobacteriota bacterium]
MGSALDKGQMLSVSEVLAEGGKEQAAKEIFKELRAICPLSRVDPFSPIMIRGIERRKIKGRQIILFLIE